MIRGSCVPCSRLWAESYSPGQCGGRDPLLGSSVELPDDLWLRPQSRVPGSPVHSHRRLQHCGCRRHGEHEQGKCLGAHHPPRQDACPAEEHRQPLSLDPCLNECSLFSRVHEKSCVKNSLSARQWRRQRITFLSCCSRSIQCFLKRTHKSSCCCPCLLCSRG